MQVDVKEQQHENWGIAIRFYEFCTMKFMFGNFSNDGIMC